MKIIVITSNKWEDEENACFFCFCFFFFYSRYTNNYYNDYYWYDYVIYDEKKTIQIKVKIMKQKQK